MHVHHGEHLDALFPPVGASDADAEAPLVSSFVVISVGDFATSECVECRRTSPTSEEIAEVLYSQHYSPFTATRVVENSSSPAWNEMLTLSLPFEWRQSEQYTSLGLKLELVQRGPSQQEDFLLATAILPLQSIACHHHQLRFSLQFPPAQAELPSARVFISLRETSRSSFTPSSASLGGYERLEVLIRSFVPEGDAGTDGQVTQRPESLALSLTVDSSSEPKRELKQLFAALQDQQAIPALAEDSLSGLAPSATKRHSGVGFQWHFPLTFEFSSSAQDVDDDARVVEVSLYDTSSTTSQHRTGSGSFPLTQILQASKNGSCIQLNPPIRVCTLAGNTAGSPPLLLGHLHASVRWWSAAAWESFLRDTPSRRVVSTNRNIRKNTALLGLDWMGALLRGLNRYPVSSFCDEGGLSSVLAGFLATSSDQATKTKTGEETGVPDGGSRHDSEITTLLTSQVTHLQAESAVQRQQIERVSLA